MQVDTICYNTATTRIYADVLRRVSGRKRVPRANRGRSDGVLCALHACTVLWCDVILGCGPRTAHAGFVRDTPYSCTVYSPVQVLAH